MYSNTSETKDKRSSKKILSKLLVVIVPMLLSTPQNSLAAAQDPTLAALTDLVHTYARSTEELRSADVNILLTLAGLGTSVLREQLARGDDPAPFRWPQQVNAAVIRACKQQFEERAAQQRYSPSDRRILSLFGTLGLRYWGELERQGRVNTSAFPPPST
jgi:hypothetical protein